MKIFVNILILFFLAAEVHILSSAPPKKDEKTQEAEKSLNLAFSTMTEVTKTAKDLEDAGVLKQTEKSKSAKAAASKLDLTKEIQDFTLQNGAQAATIVANGVSKGLPDLVKGFKTKQWYYILSGRICSI